MITSVVVEVALSSSVLVPHELALALHAQVSSSTVFGGNFSRLGSRCQYLMNFLSLPSFFFVLLLPLVEFSCFVLIRQVKLYVKVFRKW